MMDVEKLIEAVYKRSTIWNWNIKHKLHYNRIAIDKCWKEIAAEMNADESALRRKWKYLRDNFAVEYGKSRWNDNVENQSSKSKWQYFQPLLFLKDIVTPRVSSSGPPKNPRNSHSFSTAQPKQELTIGDALVVTKSEQGEVYIDHDTPDCDVSTHVGDDYNRSTSESNELLPGDEENDHWQHEDIQAQLPTCVYPSPCESGADTIQAQPRAIKRRRNRDDFLDKMLDFETKKLKYHLNKPRRRTSETQSEDDSDLLFFRTLLPHVRLIPQHMKLRFQIKVQTIVQDFAYGDPQPRMPPSVEPYQQSLSTHSFSSPASSSAHSIEAEIQTNF